MNPRAAAEFVLFLVAALAGIYGFGQAFQGNGLWLAVSAVALVVIAKQMARIQDRWPRRRSVSPPTINAGPATPAGGQHQTVGGVPGSGKPE